MINFNNNLLCSQMQLFNSDHNFNFQFNILQFYFYNSIAFKNLITATYFFIFHFLLFLPSFYYFPIAPCLYQHIECKFVVIILQNLSLILYFYVLELLTTICPILSNNFYPIFLLKYFHPFLVEYFFMLCVMGRLVTIIISKTTN